MPKKKMSKTAFVLGLGSVPADEAVKKAKAEGMTLTRAHVYTIRAHAKLKAKKRGPGRPPGKRGPGRPLGGGRPRVQDGTHVGDAERTLLGVVLALGLTRTRELVDKMAERLEAVLR
jgi:hypothetical protein